MRTAGEQRGKGQAEVASTVVVRMGGRGTVLVAVQVAVGRKEAEDRMVVADRVVAQTVVGRKGAEDGPDRMSVVADRGAVD